jgi:hypothetical protein
MLRLDTVFETSGGKQTGKTARTAEAFVRELDVQISNSCTDACVWWHVGVCPESVSPYGTFNMSALETSTHELTAKSEVVRRAD